MARAARGALEDPRFEGGDCAPHRLSIEISVLGPLTPADFALVGKLVDELHRLRREEPALQIGKVVPCRDGIVGGRLTSDDRRCTLIQVPLGTPFLAVQTRTAVDRTGAALRKVVAAAGPDAPALYATGSAGIGRDLTAVAVQLTIVTVIAVAAVVTLRRPAAEARATRGRS